MHLYHRAPLGRHTVVVDHDRSLDTAALAGHEFEEQLAFFFPRRNLAANVDNLLHAGKAHIIGFGHLHIGRHRGQHTAIYGEHIARTRPSDDEILRHFNAVERIEFHLFLVKPTLQVLERHGRVQHIRVIVALVFLGDARPDEHEFFGGKQRFAQQTRVRHHGRHHRRQMVQGLRHIDVHIVDHRRTGR